MVNITMLLASLIFYQFTLRLLFSGLITAISAFDGTGAGVFVGILLLVIAIGYAVAACGDLLLLSKVRERLQIDLIFDEHQTNFYFTDSSHLSQHRSERGKGATRIYVHFLTE